jgi:hypothetical protein
VPLRGSSAKSRFSKLYALLFERFDYFGSVGTSWWRGDFFQERVEDGLGIEWYSRFLGSIWLDHQRRRVLRRDVGMLTIVEFGARGCLDVYSI